MESLYLSLQDWIVITSALGTAMSPAYVLLWQMKSTIAKSNECLAVLSNVVKNCPYCNKNHKIIEVDDLE